jgi:hypothetical protein
MAVSPISHVTLLLLALSGIMMTGMVAIRSLPTLKLSRLTPVTAMFWGGGVLPESAGLSHATSPIITTKARIPMNFGQFFIKHPFFEENISPKGHTSRYFA